MKSTRRNFLLGCSALALGTAVNLSATMSAEAWIHGNASLAFRGNPNVNISAINTSGGIAVSRTLGSGTLTSITRSGTTATATVAGGHGFPVTTTPITITMAGAGQSQYNSTFACVVTSTTVFTFTVTGNPTSPATGTITYSVSVCTPAFVQVSASAITATGTDCPYEDLSYAWNFGDPGGTEVFTNPVTNTIVNANSDQTGPEAAYCYRTAGAKTITLTISGKSGGGYTSTTTTTTIPVTDFTTLPGVLAYYVSSSGGSDSNNGTSPGTPFQTLQAASLAVHALFAGTVPSRVLLKRGDTWDQSSIVLDSVTSSGTTATATIATGHGLVLNSTAHLSLAGAAPAGYNLNNTLCTVGSDPTTFTYVVANGLATPATGTITFTRSAFNPNTTVVRLRLDAYGTGANPILSASSGNLSFIVLAQTLSDIVLSNIQFAMAGTYSNPFALAATGLGATLPAKDIYLDNLNLTNNGAGGGPVTSITRSGTTATVLVPGGTGLPNGSTFAVIVDGATPAGYNTATTNGAVAISGGFTYIVNGSLATPATGTITYSQSQASLSLGMQGTGNSSPFSGATNLGAWGCTNLSSPTDISFGGGAGISSMAWGFHFGLQIAGNGSYTGDPTTGGRNHHIYSDILTHSLFRWIKFGPGPQGAFGGGRGLCIKANWDAQPTVKNCQAISWLTNSGGQAGTVTVQCTAHGFPLSSTFTLNMGVAGFDPATPAVYNVSGQVATVIDADHFTYPLAVTADPGPATLSYGGGTFASQMDFRNYPYDVPQYYCIDGCDMNSIQQGCVATSQQNSSSYAVQCANVVIQNNAFHDFTSVADAIAVALNRTITIRDNLCYNCPGSILLVSLGMSQMYGDVAIGINGTILGDQYIIRSRMYRNKIYIPPTASGSVQKLVSETPVSLTWAANVATATVTSNGQGGAGITNGVNVATNAITAAGTTPGTNDVLHFTSGSYLTGATGPFTPTAGWIVTNTTNPTSIPIGTRVKSVTATTITLTAFVEGSGVGNGDNIIFTAGLTPGTTFVATIFAGSPSAYNANKVTCTLLDVVMTAGLPHQRFTYPLVLGGDPGAGTATWSGAVSLDQQFTDNIIQDMRSTGTTSNNITHMSVPDVMSPSSGTVVWDRNSYYTPNSPAAPFCNQETVLSFANWKALNVNLDPNSTLSNTALWNSIPADMFPII